MVHGSIPALITPFRNGIVDEQAFQALVARQISEGTHGLVPCGTTGESVTLSTDEHVRVVEMCVEVAAGKVPVIAGAGSNDTAHAVELAAHAKRVGADAGLVVAPYYNKPSQDGMFAHFKAINDAVDIPIYLYNVPGRTIVDLTPETVGRLALLENVAGIKDASNDLGRIAKHRTLAGAKFIQLSGDDPNAIGFNAHGGRGCISVTANVAPKLCAQLQDATLQGAFDTARAIDDKLWPLHKALFCEPSPAPAKYACSLLGLCTDEVRLPIIPCSDAAKAQIRSAMTHAGLI
ncbi:MAG: 4-hydroxy-tetrahydrodipicolinate synthase [Hyphomonadaceae bacterium]|nr:4-hydroxy-tetrahydrodipicolinate synthase [Hyphomonadaceae bacterium]